jgi:uncharacterized phage protein (TIGR01671 family)
MQRIIKFRGKTSKNPGCWVFGKYAEYKDSKGDIVHCIVIQNEQTKEFAYNEVYEDTIGQFTGLFDKNGKEIYDGDILKNNLSKFPFALVGWHQNGYFFCDCNMGSHPSDYECNEYTPLGKVLNFHIDGKKVKYEVIGNRWDTPGLLER